MKIKGDVRIRASRDEVWKVVTDPEAVCYCTPGMRSMEVITPGRKFHTVGSVGLGTARVDFSSYVEFTELDPPGRARMRLSCEIRERLVEISSEMNLSERRDGTTRMRWTADVQLIGSRGLTSWIIKPLSKKMTHDLIVCLKKRIERNR